MIGPDAFVVFLLLLAVVTGLRTMRKHHSFFVQFTTVDLMAMRFDALLYLLLAASTTLCMVDAFLRLLWGCEIGWSNVGSRWAIMWLGMHTAFAGTSTLLHVLIGRLLGNSELCELCRREF